MAKIALGPSRVFFFGAMVMNKMASGDATLLLV